MFNKLKFSQILNEINNTYDTMTEFAEKSGVNRTYLSQYINQKLDNPPSPKVLMKIANYSNGITNYEKLMEICGYIDGSKQLIEYENYELFSKMWDKYWADRKKLLLSSEENNIIHELLQPILPKIDKDFILTDDVLNFLLEDASYLDKKTLKKVRDGLAFDLQFNIELSKLSYLHNKLPQKDNLNTTSQYYMCPVYGQISAGQPNWAEENIEGRIPIDTDLMDIYNPEEYFFLRVNGESMNKIVKNGAFALIHKQDIVENGEIAVILVNGYDATLKKFTRQGELIILEPNSTDESFETQVYDKTTTIKILGKYVGKLEINK